MADQPTMLSQGEDDDSEEAETINTSVSQNLFYDVMTGMTLRLEQYTFVRSATYGSADDVLTST